MRLHVYVRMYVGSLQGWGLTALYIIQHTARGLVCLPLPIVSALRMKRFVLVVFFILPRLTRA